jgi:hypothetical protein
MQFDDRWDEQATDQLPAYLREFYLNTLSSTNGIEEDLKFQNNKHAELVKELVTLCSILKIVYHQKLYALIKNGQRMGHAHPAFRGIRRKKSACAWH